ncbi:MAG: radical SAM protein [Patescibacteria group bacterium]|nr:radical SAM protein [Patescibacteria group bacterium]
MLILRPETFGGFVFNTKNGTRLWLDRAGYDAWVKFLTGGQMLPAAESTLRDACQQLELQRHEEYLVRPGCPQPAAHPFTVLTAPTLVDLQITGQCNLACPHCYAQSSPAGHHVPLADILLVLDRCMEAGVFEVALGGGEPTLHPQLEKILAAAARRHLVCNLATNGKAMDKRLAKLLKRYCGAVALSIEFTGNDFEKRRGYPWKKFLASAQLLQTAGVRLVFQITVSRINLATLHNTVATLAELKPYGVVFLTYKPVGRAQSFDSPLTDVPAPELLENFSASFRLLEKRGIKIGYDCCMGNLLTGLPSAPTGEIHGCSALRESVAVNCDLEVLPCSFATQLPLGNLRASSLSEIWRSEPAENFRQRFARAIGQAPCAACRHRLTCLGGCPAFDLVKCQAV